MQPNFVDHHQWRKLRRKSTLAQLTNEFRRNSRLSTASFDHARLSDGRLLYAINFFPFQNGLRRTGGGGSQPIWPPRSSSPAGLLHPAILAQKKRLSGVWAQAYLASTGHDHSRQHRRHRLLLRLTALLQTFYDKSRFHYLLPILVLVVYSVLGGAIFYYIESPAEQSVLLRKREMVEREERGILEEINSIERRLHAFYTLFSDSEVRNAEIRQYRAYTMNRLDKAVYWYVLQVYYLNDQETYKSVLLHPNKPERLWRSHFGTDFGRIEALRNYTDQLSLRCWEIGSEWNTTRATRRKKLQHSVKEFKDFTGLQYVLTPTWTFWNSMFLAVTTYSTIGYGNITPKTNFGRLAAMVYAVIGIPLLLVILQKLGRFFLLCLEHVWIWIRWCGRFAGCPNNGYGGRDRKGSIGTGFGDSVSPSSEDGSERPSLTQMPVTLAVGIAFSWMFLCAAIFLKFEPEWDYFKSFSFYFFFCSLTTIGYGDVTPTRSEDMFIIFGFIIVGLSLVSMCINVIQLKLEELFEELLLTMMEEYATSQAEGLISGALKPPKMGFVDLWKAWKRRRRRAKQHSFSQQVADETPDLEAGGHIGIMTSTTGTQIPELLLPNAFGPLSQGTPAIGGGGPMIGAQQHKTTPPPSLSPLQRPALVDVALRRFLLPSLFFSERRRALLVRKLQQRLNQRSKAVQTDFRCTCFLQQASFLSPTSAAFRGSRSPPMGSAPTRAAKRTVSSGGGWPGAAHPIAGRQPSPPNYNTPYGRVVYYYIDPSPAGSGGSTSSGPYLRNSYSAVSHPVDELLLEADEFAVEGHDGASPIFNELQQKQNDDASEELSSAKSDSFLPSQFRRPASVTTFLKSILETQNRTPSSSSATTTGMSAATTSLGRHPSKVLVAGSSLRLPQPYPHSFAEQQQPFSPIREEVEEETLPFHQSLSPVERGARTPEHAPEKGWTHQNLQPAFPLALKHDVKKALAAEPILTGHVAADFPLSQRELSGASFSHSEQYPTQVEIEEEVDEEEEVDDETPPMKPPPVIRLLPSFFQRGESLALYSQTTDEPSSSQQKKSTSSEDSTTKTTSSSSFSSEGDERRRSDFVAGRAASSARKNKGHWRRRGGGGGGAAGASVGGAVHLALAISCSRPFHAVYDFGRRRSSSLSSMAGGGCSSASPLSYLGYEPNGHPCRSQSALTTTATHGPRVRLVTLLSADSGSSPLASSSSSSPVAGGPSTASTSSSSTSIASYAASLRIDEADEHLALASPLSEARANDSVPSTEDERLPAVPEAKAIQRFVRRRMSLAPPLSATAISDEDVAGGGTSDPLLEPIQLHFPPHTRYKRPSISHHVVVGGGQGREGGGLLSAGEGRGDRRRATFDVFSPASSRHHPPPRESIRSRKRRRSTDSDEEAAAALVGSEVAEKSPRKGGFGDSMMRRFSRRLTLLDPGRSLMNPFRGLHLIETKNLKASKR